MNAFISYSHKDKVYLDKLHTHLATLRREDNIIEWTDQEIHAGSKFNNEISNALKHTELFIALVSPDYLASNYCYEKEFKYALKRQEEENLIIVPIIVEDCDWFSTPFSQVKALPKDGKPIANWSNQNTAYLNIIQELRKLILAPKTNKGGTVDSIVKTNTTRNYKIKKDFDSLEKMEEVEKTFQEVKEKTIANIREIKELDNIKAEVLKNEAHYFEAIIVNRNKTGAEEARLLLTTENNATRNFISYNRNEFALEYEINKDSNQNSSKAFNLHSDEYNMYWQDSNFSNYSNGESVTASKMADKIWKEWLSNVGIEF